MDYQVVSVSVPADRVGDLLTFAAELARSTGGGPKGEIAPTTSEQDAVGIREAYLGGESIRWRPFLDILVRQPGDWVEWPELCRLIDFKPAQAAGMLGAAERRCRQNTPYEKKQVGGKQYFRVTPEVAAIINEVTGR
ncbi:hypothetical protein [Pseudonocardia xinjiangensis]|uniref:DNA-binding protein n=1 Tax=Pseudonocardia xinjiangensis TaxID=75289 RepID=A0ABX1RHZ5_9PSEU|nr:hypothetical protein [Pseudonocardia xinjiangensis]NMH80011.1 hypothetical protein [Pseudonocardia xinjiangensis]